MRPLPESLRTFLEGLMDSPPIRENLERCRPQLQGKPLWVTGAGGSIGSALSRSLLRFRPARLILLECSEEALHSLVQTLKEDGSSSCLIPVLGDAGDAALAREIIREHRPQVVFHTAAYKQVAFLERYPLEAIRNNSLATRALALEASRGRVERFIFLSTDKVVCPTSIVGASKRLAELFLLGQARTSTLFTSARLGNVLGSRGSVLPLWREQVARREPLTITHLEAERFFLRLEDAVGLLLDVTWLGRGGDILVPEMGRPIKILELAKAVVRSEGLDPEKDLEVRLTGLRPGEKLSEECFFPSERPESTEHPRMLRAVSPSPSPEAVEEGMSTLTSLVEQRDTPRLLEALRALLPEYRPSRFLTEPEGAEILSP